MKKVLAVLAIRPQYIQFALPQLKSILYNSKIPLRTLFSQSMPLPENNYEITHKNIKSFPFITLTVPDFDHHRAYFEQASKKAVMVSKLILLLAQGNNYDQLLLNKDEELLSSQCRNWNQNVSCQFTSRNRVIQRQQQIKKIHKIFQKLDIRGKVDIKNPQKRYHLIQNHLPNKQNQNQPTSQTLSHLSSYKSNNTKFNSKYQLSNRIYLGPTSTDNDLAFLMCNQAHVQSGHLVFDPFVGTAGLLIPPAIYGAFVFGCDLDMRVLNGYAVGRINKKSTYYSKQKMLQVFTPKIQLNFDQYQLSKPNIMRMDCTKNIFAPHTKFDAIITDPPYGLRAMSRSVMKKQQNKIQIGKVQKQDQNIIQQNIKNQLIQQPITAIITQQSQKQQKQQIKQLSQQQQKQKQKKAKKKQKAKQTRKNKQLSMSEEQKNFKNTTFNKLNQQRINNWGKFDKEIIGDTQRQVIFQSLLNLARKHLKVGGRLVFLYPIYEDQQFLGVQSLPKHQSFELIDMSRNILSRNTSRVLVTLQKK